MPIRIILADDHPIVLDGLENLFRLDPAFQMLARCVNGEETVAAVRSHRPNILILDLHMPRKNGLDVLRDLRKSKVPTRAVLLAAALEENEVLEALRLGVRGIVLKELAPQLLVQCVRKVHAGEQWLDNQLLGRALDTLLQREAAGRDDRHDRRDLTARELDIVRMAAGGLPVREMAKPLAISEGTVKIHLHHIYKKLKVQNRVQLVLYAQSQKLL